jgi:MFS family permease
MGPFHSSLFLVALLSLMAAGVYSVMGPFWALPGEFLTGFSAAAGIGLINSVANLGGFVGPYAIGVMSGWAGGIYGGLALAGIPLLVSATLLVLLPRRAQVRNFEGSHSHTLSNRARTIRLKFRFYMLKVGMEWTCNKTWIETAVKIPECQPDSVKFAMFVFRNRQILQLTR